MEVFMAELRKFKNYTVAEAAFELGCCEATVLNRIKAGVILAYKVGRNYQITPDEVQRIKQKAFDEQRDKIERRLLKIHAE